MILEHKRDSQMQRAFGKLRALLTVSGCGEPVCDTG